MSAANAEKIDVVCFGLQGFGNDMLEQLVLEENVTIKCLYTRKQTYKFLYYDCETIEETAAKYNIPLTYIPEKGDWECEPGTIAIVSSFHRIFRKSHLMNYRYAINIHPSLLPSYKGATPIAWMAKNAEKIVGVTAHLIDETTDGGEIIFQRQILNPYLFDNELHRVLSFTSRQIVSDIVRSFPEYPPVENTGIEESQQPKRTIEDAIIDVYDITSIRQLIFHIKAFTNYPMPRIAADGKLFVIDYQQPREFLGINVEGKTFEVPGWWESPDAGANRQV